MSNKLGPDGKLAILIVYVDDIIIAEDYVDEIDMLKKSLADESEVKYNDKSWYFLEIVVAQTKEGIAVP